MVGGSSRRVGIGEQLRLRVSPERDERTGLLTAVRDEPLPPARDEVERVGRGVPEPRSLHVLIPVDDAHEARFCLVRRLGNGARERCVLDVECEDDNVLARGDVRADANCEGGERLGRRRSVHARMLRQATARAQSP